jgi:hypothetical protein
VAQVVSLSRVVREGALVPEPLIDVINSLDGYGAAEGRPGGPGLQAPRRADAEDGR